MTEKVLFFGKWGSEDVKIRDISLQKYLDLKPKHVPHTFGRSTRKRFLKGKMNLVERLVNKMMRSGQGKRKLSGKYIRGRGACGKKILALKIVEEAFDIVEQETKENPIQILVRAIENAAPKEDITRIQKGGIAYTLSVDVSPLKRIDESLKNIALAAFASSFSKKISAREALAKELILTAKNDPASYSLKRKDEIERIAVSSR